MRLRLASPEGRAGQAGVRVRAGTGWLPRVMLLVVISPLMAGGMRRAAVCAAALAVTGSAFAAGNASAASSQLVYSKPVGRDMTRYEYRYGPLFAAPGQNLILLGPVTIEKPPGDGYATRVRPDLVDSTGKAPPIEQVHMHHAVMLT